MQSMPLHVVIGTALDDALYKKDYVIIYECLPVAFITKKKNQTSVPFSYLECDHNFRMQFTSEIATE